MESKKSRRRKYKGGVPQHIYFKGKESQVIFYGREDCIWFVTLLYCDTRKYGVRVLAMSIMHNHAHHASVFESRIIMSRFQQEFESTFAREYNKIRKKAGAVFKKQFGSASKSIVKSIRSCILYIFANPIVGRLSHSAKEYRWNLLAYKETDHPYSEAIDRRHCSRAMKRSIKIVDSLWNEMKPLKYRVQERIFDGLDTNEQEQITDYILSKYNCLDYSMNDEFFGDYETLCRLLDTTMAKEYDIKEDWEDYSCYDKMLNILRKSGYDEKYVCPEDIPEEQRISLEKTISRRVDCPLNQIRKFLHM